MTQNSVRLDKWLWASRFFKTRELAATAVNGGKVHMNGIRTKPGRPVAIGSTLNITKGPYTFEIVVRELSDKRGPASVAQTLYEESENSRQNRQALSGRLRLDRLSAVHAGKRPDKRDRRRRLKVKGKGW